jgi:hypothetical protein
MPRQRKTNRGPSPTVVPAAPFTPAMLHALLCDKVVLTKKAKAAILPDSPAIAHLVHVLNILQWKVRAAPWEPPGATAKTYGWLHWPAIGVMPQLRGDGRVGRPDRLGGHIEPAGLGSFAMQAFGRAGATEGELMEEAHRQGRERAARQHAYELVLKSYGPGRDSLLTRSIGEWKDYAPELADIFCSELPNLGEEATYRFIKWTAPMITGEEPSVGAIEIELKQGRWRDRTPSVIA